MTKIKSAMLETRLDQVDDYSTAIAYANKQEIVYYQRFGSYQGEWILVTRNDENYYIYKDWYGSCSGCDNYEGTFSWQEQKTEEKVKEFAKGYPPFAEVPKQTMVNLVTKGTLAKIFPANIRDSYSEVNYEDAIKDISLEVKIEGDMPITGQDILNAVNQETKQRGLKKMGYEKFVEEVKPQVIEEDGENSLLQIQDIVFVYVKDSSTPRRYLLRVPPNTRSVKEGVAWTFGKEIKDYNPIKET